MEKFIKYISKSLLLLSLLTMVGCDGDLWKLDDDSKGSYKVTEGCPIATTLDESGEFAEWVHVLEYSETYSIMNALYDGQSSSHKFTMFVPTDDALAAYYAMKGVQTVEELGQEYAKAMVKCMTYDGDSLKLSEVFDQKTTYKSYSSQNGDALRITVDTVGDGFLINDSIAVSRDYVKCSNGFYYTVQGVVTPLLETLYDRLVQDGQSSIMMEALDQTGYLDELKVVADTTYTLGIRTVTRHYFTLLNVHDDAFAVQNIYSLADLKTALKARSKDAEADADSLLKQYVQYHLFNTNYSKSAFVSAVGEGSSANMATMADNQILTVSTAMCGEYDALNTTTGLVEHDTAYYVSFNDEDTTYNKPAYYIVNAAGLFPDYGPVQQTVFLSDYSNITSRNGYLHTISTWLPIYEPEQTTVVWDLADNVSIRNKVGGSYQPSAVVSKEDKIDISDCDCFEVTVGEGGKAGSTYSEVCYVTCKSNLKNCLNFDRVAFDLGYQGSVVMTTPTLVKGKYKVEISIAYLSDQSFIRTCNGCKGGQMNIYVDGENKKMVTPYTTITSSATGVYTSVLYDEIEFTTTSSHKLKFVVMDPAASTNSKFALQFDAITFTPIE